MKRQLKEDIKLTIATLSGAIGLVCISLGLPYVRDFLAPSGLVISDTTFQNVHLGLLVLFGNLLGYYLIQRFFSKAKE